MNLYHLYTVFLFFFSLLRDFVPFLILKVFKYVTDRYMKKRRCCKRSCSDQRCDSCSAGVLGRDAVCKRTDPHIWTFNHKVKSSSVQHNCPERVCGFFFSQGLNWLCDIYTFCSKQFNFRRILWLIIKIYDDELYIKIFTWDCNSNLERFISIVKSLRRDILTNIMICKRLPTWTS